MASAPPSGEVGYAQVVVGAGPAEFVAVARIHPVTGSIRAVDAHVEGVMVEYLRWCASRLETVCGVTFDDPEAAVSAHHHAFLRELPQLTAPRGRLLVARRGDRVVGVGALKPVSQEVAEIKRMYVRPEARGQGVGRALMERLLHDARQIGYRVARLETATFMAEAHRLYRSLGFNDVAEFDRNEAGLSGLERHMYFMQLTLVGPERLVSVVRYSGSHPVAGGA